MLAALIAIPAVTVAAPMSKVASANPKLRANCGTGQEKCRTTIFYGPYDDKSACKGASYCFDDASQTWAGYDNGYYCQTDSNHPISSFPEKKEGRERSVYHFKDSAVTRKLGKGDYRCLFCNYESIFACTVKENEGKFDLRFLRGGGPEGGIWTSPLIRTQIKLRQQSLRSLGLTDDIFGNCISKLCTREHIDIHEYMEKQEYERLQTKNKNRP
jgi:hypothetical protein